MENTRLKIAVQKSGRLSERSLDLLSKCGITLEKSKDQLLCRAQNFPLDVLLVRDDDIPAFIATDVCQLGIVGENVLFEAQECSENGSFSKLETLIKLGFGRCRLSLAVPNEADYNDLNFFNGKTIATSYKGLLAQYLQNQNIDAKIVTMRGAVEIAPKTHLADAICDLVSTGSTLTSNGLKEVETILNSQAVLIKNSDMPDDLNDICTRLVTRMSAVLKARSSRYIVLHAPINALDEIKTVLPGSEAPTIIPLKGCDKQVAVHAVSEEEVFWNTMEDLKAKGASSILVLPIEKMMD
ncbi:MAG: ATP phosphoribosyltransferase [Alphaproteobacteria bacterium]|nr:ATP phosphoribosyltransferase [Alphaproteobacteria bacterium]